MSEYTELAKECGATLTISQGENGWFNDGGAIFQKEQLTAFAAAIRRKTLEAVDDLAQDALQSSVENGVKCLNESAAKDLRSRYPELIEFIGRISEMAQEGVTK